MTDVKNGDKLSLLIFLVTSMAGILQPIYFMITDFICYTLYFDLLDVDKRNLVYPRLGDS